MGFWNRGTQVLYLFGIVLISTIHFWWEINIFLTLLKSQNIDFIREGANFQEGVVGGKMNSETIGQRVKVVS